MLKNNNDFDYEIENKSIRNTSNHPDWDEYLREISSIPVLTAEEECILAREIAQGNKEAKDKFINSNLKLVVSVAKRYIGSGVDFLDLIQEGNIGLITAVERFDPDLGFKFSTYAIPWIKNSINQALWTRRGIKLPRRVELNIQKYKQVQTELSKELCREPTREEIAKRMGITVKNLHEIEMYTLEDVSLSTLVGEKQDTELENFIRNSSSSPEDIVIESRMIEILVQTLEDSKLSQRERDIISLRNGFFSNPKTLDEIAKKYGLSRERIRQIEEKALKKLRKSKAFSELIDGSNNLDKKKVKKR